MREIKFRAWDNPSKSFVEDVTDLGKAKYYKQPLMQYTGLKDKKGKEIYEGDIVKRHQRREMFETIVIRDLEEFLMDRGFNEGEMMEDYSPKSLEVIGNIYENPELLKEAEK